MDVVFTMLPNDDAVKKVYRSFIKHYTGDLYNTLFIDCSTVSPMTSKELQSYVRDHGCDMVDAPVSGGVKGAENKTLTFMCGGNDVAFSRAKPLLLHMGKNVVHCGDIGMGAVAKLCNNLALGIQMIGICEATNLGSAMGIDPNVLAGVMNSSTAKCWSSDVCNPHPDVAASNNGPAANDYEGGFGTSLMLKDIGLAVNAGHESGLSLPLGSAAREIYNMAEQRGLGKKDFGAVLQFLRGSNVE